MRLLFAHYGPYLSPRGGGSKCDRRMVEVLAGAGHDCLIVLPGYGEDVKCVPSLSPGMETRMQLGGATVIYVHDGCQRYAAAFRRAVDRAIRSYSPDFVIVTGTDHGHVILKTIIACGKPVIYIPRCTWDLCWGPSVPYRNPASQELIRHCHRVYVHSNYMQAYVRRWFGVEAFKLQTPLPYAKELTETEFRRIPMGRPFRFGMVNPSLIKGIDILVALAESSSCLDFFVVPGWATTSLDVARLSVLHNVRILKPFDDPRTFFSQVDVLLVPSVWDEAFGCVALESLLCGVPVLASNIGGLPEAMCGAPFLLPVHQIETYLRAVDEKGVPVPIVPEQDIREWLYTMSQLAEDSSFYHSLSCESRAKATAYAARCTEDDIVSMCDFTR